MDIKKGILLESGTNEVEFLEFQLADQSYGVNVAKITQISVWDESKLTTLPQSDKLFLGTMLFRDKCIGIYDLKALLNIEKNPSKPVLRPLLIVMEFNKKTNGFIIDAIKNIQRISWQDFHGITTNDLIIDDSAVIGTVSIEERIIMILDLEALLSELDPTLSVHQYAQQMNHNVDRSSIRVLYCEDSSTVRNMTLQMLQKAGFSDIKSYPNAAQGLKFLNSDECKGVDIILSDIEMPELDGLAFCKAVKTNEKFVKIPFVFFSSLINDQMREKCFALKGSACFSKPEIHLVAEALDRLYQENIANT